jgi:hypothetical protein
MDLSNDTHNSSSDNTQTNYPEPQQLTVYSLIYHPSLDASNLEDANIGVFPPSLIPNNELTTDSNPLTFMVLGREEVKPIYVIGHEFSAQGNTCYLPRRLLNDGFIPEGGTVSVSFVELPAVTRMVLEPECDAFAEKTLDPKADLENIIVTKYQVISLNDTITVNGEILRIAELEPADIVSTFNSDPTVEFVPSIETQHREQQEERRKKEEQQRKQEEQETQQTTNTDLVENNTWQPFSGHGNRLDGTTVSELTTTAESSNNSFNKRRNPQIKTKDRYQSFSGKGHRLGTE